MDATTFPFTEDELDNAGLLGGGVSGFAAFAVKTMKEHPDLLKLSLFTLQCMNWQYKVSSLPPLPSMSSSLSTLSKTTSEYAPEVYERTSYYNGITGDSDHPELIYRSDFRTTPFPKPTGRYGHIPVKSVRGVFDTTLNDVWDTVGPQIRDIIKAQNIPWSSIDPARFFTHGSLEDVEAKGSLGPVVIWIGVIPGSTSADTAHNVSQQILTVLLENGVKDVVVEWREAVPQRLAGFEPLMRSVGSADPTHHVRRFLTPLHGVPLSTEEKEEVDSQGTLTLWFHENKDKDGNPSNKVYGVSCCHVLRKNTAVNYENKNGAVRGHHVQVCGMCRFQRGLDEITKAVSAHGILADRWACDIVKLRAKQQKDPETTKEMRWLQRKLEDEHETIVELEALHDEVTHHWSDINLHRSIGYIQYAPAVGVDEGGGTQYTLDWAAFLAAEAKVRPEFEGNVVDLGSKYSLLEIANMFYPVRGSTILKFPEGRKLRIVGCVTKEDLAVPTEFDNESQRCLMVGKDGNTTDLTVGCYAGLVSFTRNEVGIESVELGIYNSGNNNIIDVFSAKGDSGSLVWHMIKNGHGEARIVGQLHSGRNKGGSTSNHITYCTPGWFLLQEIKKKFKYADFYRTTWS